MKSQYPVLPDYRLSWRSIQVEPIPHSGERIGVGAIVKGEDQSLIAANLVPVQRLKDIYGKEFGGRIAEALQFCIDAAEKFYSENPLSCDWTPPLERFYLGSETTTLAENIDQGLRLSAMHSSSFCVALNVKKSETETGQAG